MYNPQIETFLRVADAGSFSKAAEQLHITSTALIKQINLLEGELGLKLFERTHRGLILTKAGVSIYSDAKYIIQYCRDSVTRAKNAIQESENVLRIGTSPLTPAQTLLDLWPKLHTLCPEIKFQLIPFENTPENAKEILGNLGKNIDVIVGIFDDALLQFRGCAGLELFRLPLCCGVPVQHRLAVQNKLTIQDLYGEKLMLIHRGWSHYVDALRDDLCQNHPRIRIIDFDFYNLEVFNRCSSESNLLIAFQELGGIHPLLKVLPVEWDFTMPYGLLFSPKPSDTVKRFLAAVQQVLQQS